MEARSLAKAATVHKCEAAKTSPRHTAGPLGTAARFRSFGRLEAELDQKGRIRSPRDHEVWEDRNPSGSEQQ